jgi:hypothetical protein
MGTLRLALPAAVARRDHFRARRSVPIDHSPFTPAAGGVRKFNPLVLSEIQNAGDIDGLPACWTGRLGLFLPTPGRSARHAAIEGPVRLSPAVVVHSLMPTEPSAYSFSFLSSRPGATATSPKIAAHDGCGIAVTRPHNETFAPLWRARQSVLR